MKLLTHSLIIAAQFVSFSALAAGEAEQQSETPIMSRTESLLQAKPNEVLRLRERLQGHSAAKNVPLQFDYEPEIPQDTLDLEEIFDLSLEPDSQAPKIFLSKFQSTAISFVDAYGNPWPIRKISSFLGGKVEIDRAIPETQKKGDAKNKEQGSGLDLNDPQAGSFTITAMEHGLVGNITVFLYGNPTPVSILLVGKPSMYHRIATMRVGDVGPQTDQSELFQETGVTLGTEADVDLNHTLYGVTPQGSEQMVVQGGEGQAWLKDDVLFLRTPLAVFSPRIIGSSPGNGKYRAYKLPATTTVMATSIDGQTIKLKIMRHPATDIYEQSAFNR